MKTEEIKILDELRDLIPPLTDEELHGLHTKLEMAGGAIMPIVAWRQKGVIIDGHHRYEHCEKMGLSYKVEQMSFANIEAVKIWMLKNQLSRRNISPKDASRLRGQLYNAEKNTQGGNRGNQHTKLAKAQNGLLAATAETIAKETGVSKNTIKRDAKFAEAYDTIKAMVGENQITEEERIIIMSQPKKTIHDAAVNVDEAKKALKPKPKTKRTPKKERYVAVVAAFKKLENDYQQMKKAITEIDEIWNNQ